ncbi:hypothetical protein PWT90_01184 [Aphanocladium album]|nr:hypothetical protein PWT90_01184 [Aphanocladium album]
MRSRSRPRSGVRKRSQHYKPRRRRKPPLAESSSTTLRGDLSYALSETDPDTVVGSSNNSAYIAEYSVLQDGAHDRQTGPATPGSPAEKISLQHDIKATVSHDTMVDEKFATDGNITIKPKVHFSLMSAIGVQYSVTSGPIAIGAYMSLAIDLGGSPA